RSSDLRSGLPSGSLGTGPLRSGSPFASRGTFGGRRLSHCAISDGDAAIAAISTLTWMNDLTSASDIPRRCASEYHRRRDDSEVLMSGRLSALLAALAIVGTTLPASAHHS